MAPRRRGEPGKEAALRERLRHGPRRVQLEQSEQRARPNASFFPRTTRRRKRESRAKTNQPSLSLASSCLPHSTHLHRRHGHGRERQPSGQLVGVHVLFIFVACGERELEELSVFSPRRFFSLSSLPSPRGEWLFSRALSRGECAPLRASSMIFLSRCRRSSHLCCL